MARMRRFFAGSNSAVGFHSFFDQIASEDAKRVYLLKGGPGTGKARLIKTMSQALEKRGCPQELFFCSSDPDSLDAAAFPRLGAAIIDATAPHALPEQLPGCRDQLVCLGNFWDAPALLKKREQLTEAGRAKEVHFSCAFRYFAAAWQIEANIFAKGIQTEFPLAKLEKEIDSKMRATNQKRRAWEKPRRLFASALTPSGYVSHIAQLTQGYQCYILGAGFWSSKTALLEDLAKRVCIIGADVEILHYPLMPQEILHVLIPAAKLAFLSECALEDLEEIPGRRIDLGKGCRNSGKSAGDQKLFRELIERGVCSLQRAQQVHAQAEQFYASAMDFQKVDSCAERILGEILSL